MTSRHSHPQALESHLPHFDACPLPLALALLASPTLANDRAVNAYAIRSLHAHTIEAVVFYLPQLVQALRGDRFGQLPDFLAAAARTSCMLAHRLVWLCETESVQDPEKNGQMPPKDVLTDLAVAMRDRIVAEMDDAQRAFFRAEFDFFESVTAISGVLKPLPTKAARRARIAQEARALVARGIPSSLYLPTSPAWQVESILVDSGVPLQSAAKVPILLAFECRQLRELPHSPPHAYAAAVAGRADGGADDDGDHQRDDGGNVAAAAAAAAAAIVAAASAAADDNGADERNHDVGYSSDGDASEAASGEREMHTIVRQATRAAAQTTVKPAASTATSTLFRQACIFKVNDDVRQDVLSLQIMQMFKTVFEAVGLELWLRPYRVLANRSGADKTIGGIIECVPNAASRAEMGQANGLSLKQHFLNKCVLGVFLTCDICLALFIYLFSLFSFTQIRRRGLASVSACAAQLYRVGGRRVGGDVYSASQGPPQWQCDGD